MQTRWCLHGNGLRPTPNDIYINDRQNWYYNKSIWRSLDIWNKKCFSVWEKKLTSAGGVLELLKKPLSAVIKATHLSGEELLLQKFSYSALWCFIEILEQYLMPRQPCTSRYLEVNMQYIEYHWDQQVTYDGLFCYLYTFKKKLLK
mgnify:CR=1 FL=1